MAYWRCGYRAAQRSWCPSGSRYRAPAAKAPEARDLRTEVISALRIFLETSPKGSLRLRGARGLLPPSPGPTQAGTTPRAAFRAVVRLSKVVEINVASSYAASASSLPGELVIELPLSALLHQNPDDVEPTGLGLV